ncbi:SURF1 family protein [Plantibacter sp. Mn2098]|uniref:SURF1 family cytochrome oxidase biogenesis protein n=1 Tax=Plantibacter sp. Mn2098 TaxID=3395266 RepID=UPI003BBD0D35
MRGWRFAFSRRWLGYLGVVIVFAIVCVLLSNWQLSRRADKEAEIGRVAQNFDAAPIPIDEALPKLGSFTLDDEWHPISMTGKYLDDQQLLVRNRPRDGNPGFEQLVPLQLADGRVFMVDRGWLPAGAAQDLPDVVPAAPKGTVEVVARLKGGEPTLPGRGAAEGQLATINLPQIKEIHGDNLYTGAYGLLVSETPHATDPTPLPAQKPVPDEGPHLSYAFQWIVFAIMGFLFLGYAIRQEYRIRNSDDPREQVRAAARAKKAAAKAKSDADVEDAILESHR